MSVDGWVMCVGARRALCSKSFMKCVHLKVSIESNCTRIVRNENIPFKKWMSQKASGMAITLCNVLHLLNWLYTVRVRTKKYKMTEDAARKKAKSNLSIHLQLVTSSAMSLSSLLQFLLSLSSTDVLSGIAWSGKNEWKKVWQGHTFLLLNAIAQRKACNSLKQRNYWWWHHTQSSQFQFQILSIRLEFTGDRRFIKKWNQKYLQNSESKHIEFLHWDVVCVPKWWAFLTDVDDLFQIYAGARRLA